MDTERDKRERPQLLKELMAREGLSDLDVAGLLELPIQNDGHGAKYKRQCRTLQEWKAGRRTMPKYRMEQLKTKIMQRKLAALSVVKT